MFVAATFVASGFSAYLLDSCESESINHNFNFEYNRYSQRQIRMCIYFTMYIVELRDTAENAVVVV